MSTCFLSSRQSEKASVFLFITFILICYFFRVRVVRRKNVQRLDCMHDNVPPYLCTLFGSAVNGGGRRGGQASGQQDRTVLDFGTGAGAENYPDRSSTAYTQSRTITLYTVSWAVSRQGVPRMKYNFHSPNAAAFYKVMMASLEGVDVKTCPSHWLEFV